MIDLQDLNQLLNTYLAEGIIIIDKKEIHLAINQMNQMIDYLKNLSEQ